MSAGNTDERLRRRVVVQGLVQDVWFRASTQRAARRVGVDGWVRNLEDGRVEAVFEGDPKAVEKMIEYSSQGPELARVDDVEVIEEPLEGVSGFQIR